MSRVVHVSLPPASGFRLEFQPLPPLPCDPAPRKRARTPTPPPQRHEDALVASLFEDSRIAAPSPARGSPFASWRGNHAGVLSEYGGVRRWMRLGTAAKVETS